MRFFACGSGTIRAGNRNRTDERASRRDKPSLQASDQSHFTVSRQPINISFVRSGLKRLSQVSAAGSSLFADLPTHLRPSRRRRMAVSLLLLAVLSCGLIGIPAARPVTVHGERHPCEGCACGCPSAEFCWDRCCCHTDKEKLRWAAANHVTPPAFLVQRVAEKSKAGPRLGPASCCSTGDRADQGDRAGQGESSSACCGSRVACEVEGQPIDELTCTLGTAQSIDSDQAQDAEKDCQACSDQGERSTVRLVRLEDAAKCRGLQSVWTLLSELVPPTNRALQWKPDPPLLSFLRPLNELAVGVVISPDPPVPWRGISS